MKLRSSRSLARSSLQMLNFGGNPQWVGGTTWSAVHQRLYILNGDSSTSYAGLTAWKVDFTSCTLTLDTGFSNSFSNSPPSYFQFVRPTVAGDLVWVGGSNVFYAVNAATGTIKFTATIPPTSTSSSPLVFASVSVANGRAFVPIFDYSASTSTSATTFSVYG